jgi:hypothetical protein
MERLKRTAELSEINYNLNTTVLRDVTLCSAPRVKTFRSIVQQPLTWPSMPVMKAELSCKTSEHFYQNTRCHSFLHISTCRWSSVFIHLLPSIPTNAPNSLITVLITFTDTNRSDHCSFFQSGHQQTFFSSSPR